MLQKKHFILPSEKNQWVRDEFGAHFSLVEEKKNWPPLWQIRISEKVTSGNFPIGSHSSGVSAIISGSSTPITLFELNFDKKRVKAAIYPTSLQPQEEVQFPILGSEHFIYLISGQAIWSDRDSDDSLLLKSGHLLQFSRQDLNIEYLNLKLKSDNDKATALWIVLHYLSNNQRA